MSRLPDMIVSSGKFVFLYVDGKFTTVINYEDTGDDGFYGVTWDKSNVYIGAVDYLYRLDSNYKLKDKIDLGSHGIHQILWHDGYLYVADTGYNFIHVIDTSNDTVVAKHACSGDDTKSDIEHLNSIFHKDGIFYVASHNRESPSFVTLYDKQFQKKKKYINVGRQIHNVYVDDDNIIYALNSRDDELLRVEEYGVVKASKLAGLHLAGTCTKFLRGFARTKDYFVVGVTTMQRIRADRDKNPSWVFFYDNDWNYVTHIELPENTQISDVRVIGEPDFAHNGLEFPYENK